VALAPRPQPRRRSSRRCRAALAATALLAAAAAAGSAGDAIEVASCPGLDRSPITFSIDCSHVRDPAARLQCAPFIENQACKVFPAYRKITGINLEDHCPTISYTIYDQDQWPFQGGDAGGYAGRCSAKLIADVSVLRKSALGPFDTHELLHVYQSELGAVPSPHILFASSQLEALREIGDKYGFESGFARLKAEALGPDFERTFASDRVKPDERCRFAESNLEARLYISNPKNVYEFWRKLEHGRLRDQADREARFNRMFEQVGGPGAKAFLLGHGCSSW
jgi:hypothetical protein